MKELLELLEHDARRPVSELAAILHRSEYEVEKDIRQLEKDHILLGYNAIVDWNRAGRNSVVSAIEVNLTPQREVGFGTTALFPQLVITFLGKSPTMVSTTVGTSAVCASASNV